MSDVKLFLKQNKQRREHVFYRVTESIKDEKGEPVLWEIRPLTSKEVMEIRSDSFTMKSVGKNVVTDFDTKKFTRRLLVESVVWPNLYSQELQDSYGVNTPEALIEEMVDNPGEYNLFSEYINRLNGLDKTLNDKVDAVKN